MTVLKVIEFPHPNLKITAQKVTDFGPTLKTFVEDMYETMYQEDGCGLAATQVNVPSRVIVLDDSTDKKDSTNPADFPNKRYFINPEIIEYKGEEVHEEGCLSFPGIYAKVKRYKWIKIRYQDLQGNEQFFESDEFISVIIQHEIDHLNGICFVDHLSPLKRNLILKKLEKRRKERL